MAIRARFKGAMHSPRPGEPEEPINYLQGIPARDLTDEEFSALSLDDQQAVADSGLYDLGRQVQPLAVDASPVAPPEPSAPSPPAAADPTVEVTSGG